MKELVAAVGPPTACIFLIDFLDVFVGGVIEPEIEDEYPAAGCDPLPHLGGEAFLDLGVEDGSEDGTGTDEVEGLFEREGFETAKMPGHGLGGDTFGGIKAVGEEFGTCQVCGIGPPFRKAA